MSFPNNPSFAKEETNGRYTSDSKPTFIIETLGCKVNQYESQAMRENLEQAGFVEKTNDRITDFYIINSCTVTHMADKDTRGLIHRFHKINPRGKIVIAGCYAELDNDRKALKDIPGVTHLVRNSEKERIAEILMTNDPFDGSISPTINTEQSRSVDFAQGHPERKSRDDKIQMTKQIQNPKFKTQITDFKGRDRAFVKIQDGCDNRCSYCKVPFVRGASRSRNKEDILREIKALLEKGFKEIVLTGVCLGAWGKDSDSERKMNLSNLIEEISGIPGLFRIRLSSVEPAYVTDDIIDTLRNNDRVCKHLHIPLQSGDNRILRAMKRPYTTGRFAHIIGKIRKRIPDAAVTTDVLVGFPGEGEKHFRNTLRFIKDIRPSRIHVFSYSKRNGTRAAIYGDNPEKERTTERARILALLGRELSMDFARSFIGKTQNTIIESCRDDTTGFLTGYTDRYIRLFVDGADFLKRSLIPVKIMKVDVEKNRVFACLPVGRAHLGPSTALGINPEQGRGVDNEYII